MVALMAQVLKQEVRDRIVRAGLEEFARHGLRDTTMAAIAARAGTAVGNVYRYFPDKAGVLAAAVPVELVREHDRLLDERLGALGSRGGDQDARAEDLLRFWIDHRLEMVVLLGRAEGTTFAEAPDRFVDALVAAAAGPLGRLDSTEERLVRLVFDNTRAAIVGILAGTDDPAEIRRMVEGFWSYQLPGVAGLGEWLRAVGATRPAPTPASRRPTADRRR